MFTWVGWMPASGLSSRLGACLFSWWGLLRRLFLLLRARKTLSCTVEQHTDSFSRGAGWFAAVHVPVILERSPRAGGVKQLYCRAEPVAIRFGHRPDFAVHEIL